MPQFAIPARDRDYNSGAMHYTSVLKIFLVLGSLFVAAGGYLYATTVDFVAVTEEATGTVVALDRMSGRSAIKPVVEWTDHLGSRRVLYSGAGSSSA